MRFIISAILILFTMNVWSQPCGPQQHYVSDFTFLNDGSLVIIGNSGVNGILMSVYEENKEMRFRLARFSPLGIPYVDAYIDYTFPEQYFDFGKAASKYNCEFDQVFQMNVLPDKGDGIFVYGSYLTKQHLIFQFSISKDFTVIKRRVRYMNQYFSGASLEQKRYWIRLEQMIMSEKELKLNCSEYRIFNKDSLCETRTGISFESGVEKGTIMKFINDGREVTVHLDGKVDCENDHFIKKLVYYDDHYYVSVVNDYEFESCPGYGYDRIPFLYKINKKGNIVWKINCATMKTEFVSQPLILTGKGLLNENIGPLDFFKKETFENGYVDSVITYYHANKVFHYRVNYLDGKIKDDQIRYFWYDNSLYMAENFQKGIRKNRINYYPGDEKKKSTVFSFDKEGGLNSLTIYSKNKKIKRRFLFKNDTCIRKVHYNENEYAQRVEDLTFTNGEYSYVEPEYLFKIALTPTPYSRRVRIRKPESALVIVQMDSTQKMDTAVYNPKSQTYDFMALPSKIISKIVVHHPDFEQLKIINYMPTSSEYHRSKIFSIRIAIGKSELENYFVGFQKDYYKPYPKKIGVILKKADSTNLVTFYQLLESLPVKIDSTNELKKKVSREKEPKNLWEYGGFVLNCDSQKVIPLIRQLQQSDLVKTAGFIKEYNSQTLIVFRNELVFSIKRKQKKALDSLLNIYHLNYVKSSPSSLETWEYGSYGNPRTDKSQFYNVSISTDEISQKKVYQLAADLYSDSLVYFVSQNQDFISVPRFILLKD